MNKIYLIGNIGQDPEIKNTNNGKSISRFSIAINDGYKDQAGQWVNKTSWFNVMSFKDLSKLSKGDKIFIEGSLNINEWQDKEGIKHKNIEINAQKVHKLIKPESSEVPAQGNAYMNQGSSSEEFSFGDDSIPF